MKYIIFEEPDGMEVPILFPNFWKHDAIANSLNHAMKPVRAGFCNSKGECWGKSVSLKLQSSPDDSDIIKRAFDAGI